MKLGGELGANNASETGATSTLLGFKTDGKLGYLCLSGEERMGGDSADFWPSTFTKEKEVSWLCSLLLNVVALTTKRGRVCTEGFCQG